MAPKSDFLLVEDGTIGPKGTMNTPYFEKALLFFESDYEQQTSTALWSGSVCQQMI